MVVFNYSGAELNAKVVYYGPALSGKTTNLEFIYERMPDDTKGKMVSMKTRTDRTLFFDFLPLDVGEINGYRTRILLYTVPGQVYYNATRKLVLKGADAVVFVADSQASKMEENIESLRNLEENLNENGLTLDTMPWVIQYNKRDLPEALAIETLNSKLNLLNVPCYEAVATTGHGIYETFRAIAGLLYQQLVERLKNTQPAPREGAAVAGSPQEPQPVAVQEPAPGVSEPKPVAQQAQGSTQPQPAATQVAEAPPQEEALPVVTETADSQPWAPQDTPQTQKPSESPDPAVQSPQAEPQQAAPPQALPESPAPGDDVSDVVDSALREVEESGAAVPAPETPQEPVDTEQKTDEPLEKEFQFASLESSQALDEDVGRVIDFEDTQVVEPDDSPDSEFIVDPFQSKTPDVAETAESAETAEATEAEAPEPEKQISPPPVVASPEPAQPSSAACQDCESVTLTVPVRLKRSQMRKTVPIKIELEIEVEDEES